MAALPQSGHQPDPTSRRRADRGRGRAGRHAAVAALAGAALLGPAGAAQARDPTQSRALWATINVCDTARHPNVLGVRGSMPGTGRRGDRMVLRIRVQYRAGDRWRDLARGGDSGRIAVGSGRRRVVQGGADFRYRPPAGGRAFVMRARVGFEWRHGRRVVFRATRLTTAGRRADRGDPRGYSAAVCTIS